MELACSVEAGLGLPGSDTEIVLTTQQGHEPNWLVASADEAAPEWPGTPACRTGPEPGPGGTRSGQAALAAWLLPVCAVWPLEVNSARQQRR